MQVMFGVQILTLLLVLLFWGSIITAVVLLIRVMLRYLHSTDTRQETAAIRRSLAQAIQQERTRCGMTQEYVAQAVGVSRQAVSKWERGESEPSTSNLIALARLFGIEAGQLLNGLDQPPPQP